MVVSVIFDEKSSNRPLLCHHTKAKCRVFQLGPLPLNFSCLFSDWPLLFFFLMVDLGSRRAFFTYGENFYFAKRHR